MQIHVCLFRYGDVDICNKYPDFCHFHALLCPGNSEVWLKDILIWIVASSKKGNRGSIETIFFIGGSS